MELSGLSAEDLRNIWLNLVANAAWVAGTLLFSAVIGVYLRDRGRFAGRWSMTITWDAEYARTLYGGPVDAPHSGGRIALAYGTGAEKNCYWGIGYFELRASTQQYAQLCVEFDNIVVGYKIFNFGLPMFFARKLKSFDLHSLLREKTREFEYGAWVQYRMVFDRATVDRLEGQMIRVDTGRAVGRVSATRTA